MTKEQHDQYDNNKNILLEPPGVMGSILLETARDRSTQYNIFNSLQMIGKKEAYIQIFLKKKQIQNRCQEILCSLEEKNINEKTIYTKQFAELRKRGHHLDTETVCWAGSEVGRRWT